MQSFLLFLKYVSIVVTVRLTCCLDHSRHLTYCSRLKNRPLHTSFRLTDACPTIATFGLTRAMECLAVTEASQYAVVVPLWSFTIISVHGTPVEPALSAVDPENALVWTLDPRGMVRYLSILMCFIGKLAAACIALHRLFQSRSFSSCVGLVPPLFCTRSAQGRGFLDGVHLGGNSGKPCSRGCRAITA